MSLTEMKNAFKEATKKELNQGGKEYWKAIGGGLLMSIGLYLYASHTSNFGQHVGRAEVLDKLSDAIDENINKN